MEDTKQARIEEFAPRWMWQICHEIDGVLMLHIMRSAGIADPDNLAAIQRLCREFPDCRLVLAHVARSFNYRNARTALRKIEHARQCGAWTPPPSPKLGAMRVALDVLGPRRVLFGSDYMVSELRGKCFTMGDGFSWLYSDLLPAAGGDLVRGLRHLSAWSRVMCLREAFEDGGFNRRGRAGCFPGQRPSPSRAASAGDLAVFAAWSGTVEPRTHRASPAAPV